MAAHKKLTAIGIKSLKPPKAGRVEILDTVVPQLALRVTPNGTKSFAVRTRIKGSGKQVRVTLGEFPSTSLEEARQGARDALNMAKRGISPTDVKQQETADKREQATNTFGAVADLFIERFAKRENRQWRETQRIFDRYVKPSWGKRPLSDITKPDVVALLDSVEDTSGIYMANRTLAAVRKLFNWAMDERGLIGATPIGHKMARAG
ncbi:MAG: Arm DNA-binding domain-containing protein, partial [Alphaproteobacteria bacterium]|nr:Arm DNA-binding domain-containing protein [Alphaproteobacteria bacterium]